MADAVGLIVLLFVGFLIRENWFDLLHRWFLSEAFGRRALRHLAAQMAQ